MVIVFGAYGYFDRGEPNTGFPNYLRRVSRMLYKLGHEAIIVSGADYDYYRIDDGIEIHIVQTPRISISDKVEEYRVNALFRSYFVNKKIDEICSIKKVDIVQFPVLAGMSLFYKNQVPCVLRLSQYAPPYFSTYLTYSKEFVEMLTELELDSGRYCDAIYGPSKVIATSFGNDLKRQVDIIETPFENEVSKENTDFYEKYLKDKQYVLFFGQLYPEKGLLVIEKIIERFLEQNEDFYFVAIGEQRVVEGISSFERLQIASGKMKDKLIVSDALTHDRLYPVIERASFVVLPSLMDNFPNACLEAMFFKRIVIGTAGASFEQLIQDGISGFLVKINDANDLLDTMNKVARLYPEEKIRIGDNARKRIDILKPQIIVEQMLAYYKDVIKKYQRCENSRETTKYSEATINELVSKYECNYYSIIKTDYSKKYIQLNLIGRLSRIMRNPDRLSIFVENNKYQKIAIYGLGLFTELLVLFLESNNIKIEYILDQNPKTSIYGIKTLKPYQPLRNVDCVIVTPVYYYKTICKELHENTNAVLLSADDFLVELETI